MIYISITQLSGLRGFIRCILSISKHDGVWRAYKNLFGDLNYLSFLSFFFFKFSYKWSFWLWWKIKNIHSLFILKKL